jgi:uncharacterized membrane protein HdeD (DUF308 family)
MSGSLVESVHELRSSWGWFLVLGLLLILAGVACIIADVTATFATIIVFGGFLIFGGVVALVQAFRVPTWSGFLLYLLSALLRGFTGYLMIRYPVVGAVGVTLIIASFFVVGGLFRAIGAAMMRFPRWGWSLFSGIVSLLLGLVLLAQMPTSSLWFIGFAIGVDLILEGASLVGFATALRRLPHVVTTYKAA